MGAVDEAAERWVLQVLPLADGPNTFTLTATDAAGNSSVTNINVVKSGVVLTIDPVQPGQTTIPARSTRAITLCGLTA